MAVKGKALRARYAPLDCPAAICCGMAIALARQRGGGVPRGSDAALCRCCAVGCRICVWGCVYGAVCGCSRVAVFGRVLGVLSAGAGAVAT